MSTCCKKAEQRTKTRVLAVILLSAYDSWKCNDFTLGSILNRSYNLGKLVLKSNENARTDFATYLGCKLRKYLN